MNNNEIAALRIQFAKQLRKDRNITLFEDNNLNRLIACSRFKYVIGWTERCRIRMQEECEKKGLRAYLGGVWFDGRNVSFQCSINNGCTTHLGYVYKVKGRMSARDFAENFAYQAGNAYLYLAEQVAAFSVAGEV